MIQKVYVWKGLIFGGLKYFSIPLFKVFFMTL